MNQHICASCGHPIKDNKAVLSTSKNDDVQEFCMQCASLFGTCAMCKETYCGFIMNPDPMPQFKVVARQIRQGGATFIEQKQVPNADRIKKFCIDGKCKCYNGDDEHPLCCRHGGCATCSNYMEKETYKFG